MFDAIPPRFLYQRIEVVTCDPSRTVRFEDGGQHHEQQTCLAVSHDLQSTASINKRDADAGKHGNKERAKNIIQQPWFRGGTRDGGDAKCGGIDGKTRKQDKQR